MLICDRCNKKAAHTVHSLIPGLSSDLCVNCLSDYQNLVQKFLGAEDIGLKRPDVAAPPVDAVELEKV